MIIDCRFQEKMFDDHTKAASVEKVEGLALIRQMADQVAQMLGNKTEALKASIKGSTKQISSYTQKGFTWPDQAVYSP